MRLKIADQDHIVTVAFDSSVSTWRRRVLRTEFYFKHARPCICGEPRKQIQWGSLEDVERLYATNNMGLTLEEFAIKLGVCVYVNTDTII